MSTQPDAIQLQDEINRLRKRLERERATRLEAEAIAEKGLRDLYERQRELQALERIARQANQDGSIKAVLQFALEEVCRLHDWKAGHGYLVHMDDAKPVLRPAGIWFSVDPENFKPFARITRYAEFHPGQGLPGRAFQSGASVWVRDIEEDVNFPRREIGIACGLRSAVSLSCC